MQAYWNLNIEYFYNIVFKGFPDSMAGFICQVSWLFLVAGVGGLEPPRHDPESCVLPLDYTPAEADLS